ncbi:38015_t:CDS:2, partial [Gigaspora margarita]
TESDEINKNLPMVTKKINDIYVSKPYNISEISMRLSKINISKTASDIALRVKPNLQDLQLQKEKNARRAIRTIVRSIYWKNHRTTAPTKTTSPKEYSRSLTEAERIPRLWYKSY